ncbi:MAG: FeoB-associated Cys-rich membrane protein [Prevotellaceae bacterium]|nr:FeoB-associated Cys-rich membrane protein [Prevotellaceae bacterium]
MFQWIVVILIGIATLAYIVFKIYKKHNHKNSSCNNCAYSDNCKLKELKNKK